MLFENLPNDEAGRRLVLKFELVALTELLVEFKHDNSVSSFVNGTIHNEIELIERCLEFGVDHVKAEMKEDYE